MAGAIKGCTGQEPVLVGKPSALMIDYIVDKYKCDRGKICMVGDRRERGAAKVATRLRAYATAMRGAAARVARLHPCWRGRAAAAQ